MRSLTKTLTTCWPSTRRRTASAAACTEERRPCTAGAGSSARARSLVHPLREPDGELYYADCRPAFRSRYVHIIQPWELIEYDEDGEAIVHGSSPGGAEIVFELQNLTENQTLRLPRGASARRAGRAGLHGAPVSQARLKSAAEPLGPASSWPNAARVHRRGLRERLHDLRATSSPGARSKPRRRPATSSGFMLTRAEIRLEVLVNRAARRGQPASGPGSQPTSGCKGTCWRAGDLRSLRRRRQGVRDERLLGQAPPGQLSESGAFHLNPLHYNAQKTDHTVSACSW